MSPRTAQPKSKTAVTAKPAVKKAEKHDFIYAVGKRKTSSARIRLYNKHASGKFLVNNKEYKDYFPYFELQNIILSPFKLLGLEGKFDVTVRVLGGGVKSQAESIRHGISRALLKIDESSRKALKSQGYLTRDPREKERKKPGLKRARRGPQWAKR